MKGGDPREARDLVRLLPAIEVREHVGSHQQPELIEGVALRESAQRVHGVGRGLPLELIQRDPPSRPSLKSERQHGHPVPRIGGSVRLERRPSRRHVEDRAEGEPLRRRFDGPQMPVVHGIEGAAEDADPH